MTFSNKQRNYIEDLIAFDTTSIHSNLDLIDHVTKILERTRARITLNFNPDKTKANLIASIGPPEAEGGVIFSGHTDTVPVTGQDWSTNPYRAVEENGKIFARGSTDMKGFCGLALAAFEHVATEHESKLQKPLHLLLTYDEEVGCIGAQNFVTTNSHLLTKPDLILVGEPTNLRPILAHKGIRCFNASAKGHGYHSSAPDKGVSAIQYNARLSGYVYRIGESLKNEGITDLRFDPSYSTVNVGTIQGGSAVNVVADECVFSFETRPVPGDNGDVLVEKFLAAQEKVQNCFKKAARDTGLELHLALDEYVSVPPFDGNEHHPGSKLLINLLDDKTVGVAPFCTEAGIFQNAGWNSIVCGPGSIEQAHQPDEFITIDQLKRGAHLIEKISHRCFEPA